METSRLYARTVARIDPQWILRTGQHVLSHKYTDPVYDEKGERVMVRERILLYGLEVAVKRTAYLRINPKDATEIFIREALVEGRLRTQIPFHVANQKLLESIRDQQTRLRMSGGWALEERLYRFYAERLMNVGSFGDLKAFLRDEHGGKDAFLFAEEEDLLRSDSLEGDLESFPDSINLSGVHLNLAYAYKPGDDEDGATLKIPVEQFESVDAGLIDWAVPGYIQKRIEFLLRGLPKEIRKKLFPLADVVQELSLKVSPDKGPMAEQLAKLIWDEKNVYIRNDDWAPDAVPDYLRPRVEVVDRRKQVVASGREWGKVSEQYAEAVQTSFRKGEGRDRLQIWKDGCLKHEKPTVHPASLPRMPLELVLGNLAGLPIKAWPGLEKGDKGVSLKLYPNLEEAGNATKIGFEALCEEALGKELGWLQRDLTKEVKRVGLGFAFMMDSKSLATESFALIRKSLLQCDEVLPLDPEKIQQVTRNGQERLRGLVPRFVDQLQLVLDEREKVLSLAGKGSPWELELDALVHNRFLREMDLSRLSHYPRYLDALYRRIQRARQNPAKDAEKAKPLIGYIRRFQSIKAPVEEKRKLRWLLEELKVQIFAQELGTAGKVSRKVVDAAFAKWENQPLRSE
jgi:ATP-dependent helicase HrpA